MSMLDVHKAALEEVNEAYHSFLLKFNARKKVVYGIVEGKDDPSFYRSVIERFVPEDWSIDLILAGNRKKVLDAERMIDWETYSRKQIAFFVDRDLTEFTSGEGAQPENLYVTDGYSIENSIATKDVVVRLLSEVHNIVDWTDSERDTVIAHFEAELSRFQDHLIPVMVQICHWRQRGVEANLNNLDLGSLFAFADGSICLKSEYQEPSARIQRLCDCVGAPASDATELLQIEAEFRALNGPARLTRGKYLVWFLAMISNAIHAVSPRLVSAYMSPPKSKATFGPKNIMVVAAPRARIPSSLKAFIESTYLSFVAAFGLPET